MEDKNLTNEESIALITEMINRAKNSYVDSGIGPIFWGVLITFCSLFVFAELQFNFDIGFDIFILAFIGFFPQVYFTLKDKKKGEAQYRSYEGTVMNATWSTFAICILLITHYSIVTQTNHLQMILMIYGVPTFITGVVKKFKPMLFGGIVCWICCIASCYTSIKIIMLMMALSAICAWLIPGIILRKRYLKLKRGNV